MTTRLFCLVACMAIASTLATQAQTIPYIPIESHVKLVRKLVRGEFADRTVLANTYRGQQFTTQRIIPGKLTGAVTEQILFLEAQLAKCYGTMFTDSSAVICSASQQATIKATQAIIAQARPLWNQQHYRNEVAFYVAEDARRQQRLAAKSTK
jgi:hypothetical protein